MDKKKLFFLRTYQYFSGPGTLPHRLRTPCCRQSWMNGYFKYFVPTTRVRNQCIRVIKHRNCVPYKLSEDPTILRCSLLEFFYVLLWLTEQRIIVVSLSLYHGTQSMLTHMVMLICGQRVIWEPLTENKLNASAGSSKNIRANFCIWILLHIPRFLRPFVCVRVVCI